MNIFSIYAKRFINFKFGLIGACLMGGIVFFINLDHGWTASTIAGLKQWIYTFLFGGAIIRLLEYTIDKTKNIQCNILISVFLISALTSALIYAVHSLKGTPEPFLSTVPTLLMAPPGFFVLALKFKKEQEN